LSCSAPGTALNRKYGTRAIVNRRNLSVRKRRRIGRGAEISQKRGSSKQRLREGFDSVRFVALE
jgi:hypothetical protein